MSSPDAEPHPRLDHLRKLVIPTRMSAGRTRRSGAGELWARFSLPVAFIVLIVFFTLKRDTFLSVSNAQNISQQAAITAIAAIGISALFISGGLDITQGAVMAFSGLATVTLVNAGVPDLLAIAAALASGVGFGLINAAFTELIKIPALIATLGTSLVIRGADFLWTGGRSTALESGSGWAVRWLGRGDLWFIPAPFVVTLVSAGLVVLALRRTRWGRHVYAIGGNEEASRTSGIRVHRLRTSVYVLGATLSAVAGIVLAGRLASAAPNTATGAEFDIITASVLGGVSIFGGEGRILRVILAALFLATLANGLVQMNVPGFWVRIVTGLVFLGALSLDRLRTQA